MRVRRNRDVRQVVKLGSLVFTLLTTTAGCLVGNPYLQGADVPQALPRSDVPNSSFDVAIFDGFAPPFDVPQWVPDRDVVVGQEIAARDVANVGDSYSPPGDAAAADAAPIDVPLAPIDVPAAPIDVQPVRDVPVVIADTGVAFDVPSVIMDSGVAIDVPSAIADSGVRADVPSAQFDAPMNGDGSLFADGARGANDSGSDVLNAPDVADFCPMILDRTPVTMYLSADDSNSVASPTIARRMLRSGYRMQPRLVRTHEFMNYYNPIFAPADRGSVRVHAAMRPGASPIDWSMQAAIQSEAQTVAQVRPMSLTFVIDTSASMAADFRLERAQAVIRTIAARLRPGDVVSASTWNTLNTVVLSGHLVTGANDPAVVAVANNLFVGGNTDLNSGLTAGYALARANFGEGRLNRVILISDGEANVGELNSAVIGAAAHRAEGEEIYLVGVGVGDGISDTVMDVVTDAGRGAYIFIDTVEEAGVMFGPRFVENIEIAARSVRLELVLPWYMKIFASSAEAVSGNPRFVDPQHLAPNDAMVFQQVLRACGPNVLNNNDVVSMRATFEDARTRAPREVASATTMGALLSAPEAALRRGEAIVAYAEMLKTGGLVGDRRLAALAEARRTMQRARALQDDAQLAEISVLIERFAWVEGLR